jgi:tRNA(adenine34) deaminase
MDDFFFMEEALKEAKKAYTEKEVPVGAVIVYQNKIIASAYNLVETNGDATSHAEMQVIKEAQKKLNNWRLNDCVLYTTLEPCLMCYGAIILSRIKKIVYGANDLRHGACGGCFNLLDKKHPIHQPEIIGGVLVSEAQALLKDFFKEVREGKNG